MRQEFSSIGLTTPQQIIHKLGKLLSQTFEEYGFPYIVHDVRLKEKPKMPDPMLVEFWGGYELTFKLISPENWQKYQGNHGALASKSLALVGAGKTISIDFGKHEYVGDITTTELLHYNIPIYTPTLIVLEKLRAICQQMDIYNKSIGKENFGKPRPRDFYDIYSVMTTPGIVVNLQNAETMYHLKECFKVKRVPLNLISQIHTTRDFHRLEESKLKDSILDQSTYRGFDFYFDFVIGLIQKTGITDIVA